MGGQFTLNADLQGVARGGGSCVQGPLLERGDDGDVQCRGATTAPGGEEYVCRPGLRPCVCRVVTCFARVSHGNMVCARARRVVAWFAYSGISPSPIPRVAGSASFNAVAFL